MPSKNEAGLRHGGSVRMPLPLACHVHAVHRRIWFTVAHMPGVVRMRIRHASTHVGWRSMHNAAVKPHARTHTWHRGRV